MKKSIILCVDDERFILNSLKTELKEAFGEKYQIETADGGEDALEIFDDLIDEQCEIPLIISDYVMPNIKGDELLKRIHEKSPQTRKIMLTGQATTEGVTNAVNWANLYRYISKPWENNDLVLTVTEALRSYLQAKIVEDQNVKLREMNQNLELKVKERTQEIIEKNKILEDQTEKLNKQNIKIIDSIRYAQNIQQAILPESEYITESIPENFIFYQPKDIVSGDFYWFSPIDRSKNKLVFAAVDCTGHGVPGAFMSIVGHNLLHQAIKEKKLTRPSDILDYMSFRLYKTFKNRQQHRYVKDGMDIALCCIDKQKSILEFSGINQSLYIGRNEELLQFKPDRLALGNATNPDDRFYTNHEIEIKTNDMIYLFSDGYADQFGGPERKKYMIKQLRSLLLKIHKLPMDIQRETIINSYNEWKGYEEQIDDVMVLGLRYT